MNLPCAWVLDPSQKRRFRAEMQADTMSVDDITQWIDGILAGATKPTPKATPPPPLDSFTTLTADNFDKRVMSVQRDVLVLYCS